VAFRLFNAEASRKPYRQRINLRQCAFDIDRDAVGGNCILLVDDSYRLGATATVLAQEIK